jgi:hypothetical protein
VLVEVVIRGGGGRGRMVRNHQVQLKARAGGAPLLARAKMICSETGFSSKYIKGKKGEKTKKRSV